MDQSPLSDLPGEIRNEIYKLVYGSDDEMEVRIDEQGVADDVPKNWLALGATCKQIRHETDGLPVTEVNTIVLKPDFSGTQYGNETLTALFDLETWLNSLRAYSFVNPKRIVIHVGELEVGNLTNFTAWQMELERIVNRIPLIGSFNTHFTFALNLTISALPAQAHHYTIRLNGVDRKVFGPQIADAILAGMKAQKREVSLLMPKEWEGMDQTAIAARRAESWGLLHLGQYALPYVLSKVCDALGRVSKGLCRHPPKNEMGDTIWCRWKVHD